MAAQLILNPTTIWDDVKAASFRGRGNLPFGRCVFDYTLLHYMQQVAEKSVLDIGSGEGRFCRKLKARGAGRVVGVDISPMMLKFARDNFPSGCEYLLGDARSLSFIGQFDFVTSTGLLPYAETIADLKAMCKSFYSNLKPGGLFLAISINCQDDGDWGNSLLQYGIESFTRLPPVNETKRIQLIGMKLDENDPQFTATLSYFEPDVYETIFKEVGFKSFNLKPTQLDPDVVNEYPQGFWDNYKAKPSHLCYIAEK